MRKIIAFIIAVAITLPTIVFWVPALAVTGLLGKSDITATAFDIFVKKITIFAARLVGLKLQDLNPHLITNTKGI